MVYPFRRVLVGTRHLSWILSFNYFFKCAAKVKSYRKQVKTSFLDAYNLLFNIASIDPKIHPRQMSSTLFTSNMQ